jgi:hypothetical protein
VPWTMKRGIDLRGSTVEVKSMRERGPELVVLEVEEPERYDLDVIK